MKRIIAIIAAAISLLSVGCKSTEAAPKPEAKSVSPSEICGEWKIESLTGFAAEKIPEATLSVIATDEDEFSLNGYSGVNSFFTNLKDTSDAFPIGDKLASTKMMGAPEDMAFEDALLKVISLAESWKLEGGKLTVTSDKSTAVFIK